MQTADSTGGGRDDEVHFELVRFDRSGDDIVVTVHGMTRMVDIDLLMQERRGGVRLSLIGDGVIGRLRAFEVSVEVAADVDVIELRGHGSSEALATADVPHDMPVVCGPDPTVHAPRGAFLHKRGDRLVLTSLTDVESAGRSVDRTMLVA